MLKWLINQVSNGDCMELVLHAEVLVLICLCVCALELNMQHMIEHSHTHTNHAATLGHKLNTQSSNDTFNRLGFFIPITRNN